MTPEELKTLKLRDVIYLDIEGSVGIFHHLEGEDEHYSAPGSVWAWWSSNLDGAIIKRELDQKGILRSTPGGELSYYGLHLIGQMRKASALVTIIASL